MPIDGVRRPALLPAPGQSPIRPMFRGLAISASGLSAQRQRIETIAQNIANADVPTSPDGVGYKRRTVMMETANQTNAMFASPVPAEYAQVSAGANGAGAASSSQIGDGPRSIEVPLLQGPPSVSGGQFGVAVTGIAEDEGETELRYEPGHPLANDAGYVRYPKIETTMEMANLADAKRLYEANASVFQVTKSMLRAALDI